MTRRVRTPAGVMRFDKAIGQVISRRTRTIQPEDILPRSKRTPGQRVQQTRQRIKEVDAQRSAALRGERVPTDTPVLYSSPRQVAEAKRARGHIVRPRGEALAAARGRTTAATAQRAVAFNPLAGRFVADSTKRSGRVVGSGVRTVTKASAARAKARKAPTVAPYVGRRRAKD